MSLIPSRKPGRGIAINSKTIAVLPALVLSLFCRHTHDPRFLASLAATSTIQIDFAGLDLISFEAKAREPAAAGQDFGSPQAPDFRDAGSLLCVRSHAQAYYDREEGLRFELCRPGPPAAEMRRAIGSRDRLLHGAFEIQEISRADLSRQLFRNALVSEGYPVQAETLYRPVTDLPAVFSEQIPQIAVAADSVAFVYPGASGRYLLLIVHDPAAAELFFRALPRAAERARSLFAEPLSHVRLTEARRGETSFLEISGSAGPAEAVVSAGPSSKAIRLYFFEGSAYALEGDSVTISDAGTARTLSVSQADYQAAGGSEERSVEVTESGELRASICDFPACDSRGISPALLAALRAQRPRTDDFCRVDDLELTEMAPFGVFTDHLDSNIKFLEFRARRRCRPAGLMIFAGRPVDPGHAVVESGQYLVFANGTGVFETDVRPADLRSLNMANPVELQDLSQGERRVLYAPDPDARWTAGSEVAHSILFTGDAYYHGPDRAGLRPDLTRNFMSPGFPDAAPENQRYALSEISPAGSYLGSPNPGDEFVEWSGEKDAAGRWTLEVRRDSDGKRVRHHFPPRAGHSAYFRSEPVCFSAPHGRMDLFLPNEASTFFFQASEQPMNAVLYAAIAGSYSSLVWHEASGTFRPHRSVPGRCLASASPGSPNRFASFFAEEPAASGRRFRFFSESNAETITEQIDGLPAMNLLLRDGEALDLAGRRGRLTFRLNAETTAAGEISDGSLFIQAVYPSPAPGEVEWLRICSVTGFIPSGDLYVHDEDSADRIVSYAARTGRSYLSSSMSLPALGCAVLLDPDFTGQTFTAPPAPFFDYAGWTIASTSAIGSGLAAEETVYLTDSAGSVLATYGLPDVTAFHIRASTGQTLWRSWPSFDSPEAWSVR